MIYKEDILKNLFKYKIPYSAEEVEEFLQKDQLFN